MSNSAVLTEWFRHVPEDKWLRDPAACRVDAKCIWDKLELSAGAKILECPCGKADLGFPLARLGAIVSGIDFNSHFIIGAKNKFQRAALEGSFKTADMRTCELPSDMDVVINWGSSFGYFSDAGNADLLQRFAAALKSGGRLLIEVANPELVIAGKATRIIASGDQVEEHWNSETRRATVIFPATDFRGPVSASVRVYTTEEFQQMIEAAGLRLTGFFGPGFAPFTADSPRLIVMAVKP